MEIELNKWLVPHLRDQLSSLGLSTAGSKEVLVKRLLQLAEKIETQLQSESSMQRYQRWGITALRDELQQHGGIPRGGRDILLADLLAVINKNPTEKSEIKGSIEDKENKENKGNGQRAAGSPCRNTSPSSSPLKKETSPLFKKGSPQPISNATAAAAASSTAVVSTPSKLSTPVKSILSPRSKRQSMPGSLSKQVLFNHVEVREFKRCHGGSLGMPHVGGWPLGLAWEVARERQSPLVAYEIRRQLKRHSLGELTPLSEEQRRLLIRKHRSPEYTDLESEAACIRQSRSRVGCDCHGSECDSSKCLCFANGIPCSQEACDCAESQLCANPERDEFDSEKVNEWRRLRLEELKLQAQEEQQLQAQLHQLQLQPAPSQQQQRNRRQQLPHSPSNSLFSMLTKAAPEMK